MFNIAPAGIQILEKDTLKEVKNVNGVTYARFDKDGRIRGLKNGNLVILEVNFIELTDAIKKKREAEALEGIDFKDIFADEEASNDSVSDAGRVEHSEHIVELKERCEELNSVRIEMAKDEKDLEKIGAGLLKLEDRLRKKGIPNNDIAFIKSGVERRIKEKQAEIAKSEVGRAMERIRKRLESGTSPGTIISMRDDLKRIEDLGGHLDGENSEEIDEIRTAVETRTSEFYVQNSEKIRTGIVKLLEGTEVKLKQITKKRDFDDWLEYYLPQLKTKLGRMMHDCPVEAHESHASIVAARDRLDTLAQEYKLKFENEYKEVRSRAAEKISQTTNLIRSEIESFINRLRDRKFKTREAAEAYISSSEARKGIEEEISLFKSNDSEAAKELERSLKVGISNVYGEIERGAYELISETGQSMVKFGEIDFPKWEARVKEKGRKNVDIVFLGDDRTKGPGIKPDQIAGDIGLAIRGANGATKVVRLYEGEGDEDDLRYGIDSYRGNSIPSAYLSQADYKKFKKLYADWSKGKKSELKRNFEAKRSAVIGWFDDVPKDKRKKPSDEERKQAIEEYANFCEENMIFLLKRVEKIADAKDSEHENGKGAVPEWSNHWVIAPEDEKMLEEMSTMFKMQLKNQEGVLNLAGHAGTGKDVLIKIFANRTSRPYFAFDCSKWTTEFELSEDIVIEAEGGASKTVKVPSTVLNAMQTPGAIMYFNEFNAMPEQAQIFLHALFDEKRSLTLKTSSGKVIRSDPTMLLASSMNPDYPGTNKPQMATRSRMVTLPVNYPPIFREKDAGDSNPNKAYSASEALKIARNISSFEDDTLEGNLNNNEFVKIWDRHVNGIDNGARNLKPEEKFDLETILALVQFSNKLREEFIKSFEKTKGSEKALPVSQPITLREMRRCSYFLNEMNSAEKTKKSPDEVARDLIEKFFLTHIDKMEDREKIKNAMKTWTSQKRLAA